MPQRRARNFPKDDGEELAEVDSLTASTSRTNWRRRGREREGERGREREGESVCEGV